jgi:Ku70/Ku80 beta-barrel domain/Ku70/Ku80 N-terminal alpha/beta domain
VYIFRPTSNEMARSSKDAVVFLLDSSPSMNVPYPANAKTSTRLSSAKTALEGMLSNLMIQSKTNEAAVIVLKTKETRHQLDHDDFPNLTMLGDGCVTRPTVELLREVSKIETSVKEGDMRDIRGDVCDGIIVAADALRKRTIGKKYSRQIIIFTDAAHALVIDQEQILRVVDSLREMGCQLAVIGLDFTESAEFETALQVKEEASVELKTMEYDKDDETGDESGNSDEGSEDEEDEPSPEEIKRETEKFLVGVARLTGGSVQAATSMQSLLDSTLGKRIPKSTRRKFDFHIAPDIVLECRFSLLLSRANLPSLKKEAIIFDEDKKPMKNGIGELMTSEIKISTEHFDPDNPDIGLPESQRTKAFKFGDDLVQIGSFDLEALMYRSSVCIRILGYAEQDTIPQSLMMGPPYGISGADSQRACGAISALSQAMHEMKSAAICTFVKTKDSDPILGALFPLMEVGTPYPYRLVFIQLPFAGDVQRISTASLDDFCSDAKMKVCDDLIDAMMLPSSILESTSIANPSLRSFHRTVVSKAIDPNASVVSARLAPPEDPMSTPTDILEKARPLLHAFTTTFPLEKVSAAKGGAGTHGKNKYWDNFDEDVLRPDISKS